MNDFLKLTDSQSRNKKLRELLNSGSPVLAPGCHDGLSARLIEQAGFDVVYAGGFAAEASTLGRPDVGLMTETEMIAHAVGIVQTVSIPVIADADTGYGNAINLIRTVHDYEQAGVSAIHIEDQKAPKRCGHMKGKEVIPAGEMVGKIKAAVAARMDPNFVLIARTDAIATDGVDEAINRALRYSDAGADLLFIEAPESEADLEKIMKRMEGRKVLLNWLEGGRTPPINSDRIKELGYALVLFPIGSVLTVTAALREHFASVRKVGTPLERLKYLPKFDDFTQAMGVTEIEKLEEEYKDPDEGK